MKQYYNITLILSTVLLMNLVTYTMTIAKQCMSLLNYYIRDLSVTHCAELQLSTWHVTYRLMLHTETEDGSRAVDLLLKMWKLCKFGVNFNYSVYSCVAQSIIIVRLYIYVILNLQCNYNFTNFYCVVE